MYAKEIPEGKTAAMTCGGIHPKLKEYLVLTTHAEVLEFIQLAENDLPSLKRIFVSSLHNLTKYSEEELNAEYELKSQKWQDFCEDVLIFYTTRLVLMKKQIPIKLIDSTEGLIIH